MKKININYNYITIKKFGDDLFSLNQVQVSWALADLTSGFGM